MLFELEYEEKYYLHKLLLFVKSCFLDIILRLWVLFWVIDIMKEP